MSSPKTISRLRVRARVRPKNGGRFFEPLEARRLLSAIVDVAPAVGVSVPAAVATASPALPVDPFPLIAQRLLATNASISNPASYPQYTDATGKWVAGNAGAWASGFYPGQLWLMYQLTGNATWLSLAQARTAPIAPQQTNTTTEDLGFMVYNSFGRGYQLTGNAAYKSVLLTAANSLATRYNAQVGALKAWGTAAYPVLIDSMMDIELLFWAARNGGGSNLYDIAVNHALTIARVLVRPDGSSYQAADFDPTTGAVLARHTVQGYADNSTWSRGQAWGIYGFTVAYRETQDARFLAAAKSMADWFISHLPADDVPYWDFSAPITATTPRDSSAAAVAASGLAELGGLIGGADGVRYRSAADAIVASLSSPAYLSGGSNQGILLHGTYNAPANQGIDSSLAWGDMYYVEALARLGYKPTAAQSAPYSGTPISLPGNIEAENFDIGGEGVAYHDLSAGNSGGQYRAGESVDIEKCAEGGYDVGWNQPGEWLDYTVNVASAVACSVNIRTAYNGANATGGTVHVECDGADVTGAITLAKTGGWQAWQTVSKAGISLPAGQHVLRLVFDKDGAGSAAPTAYLGNVNWLKLALIPPIPPASTLPAPWASADIGNVGKAGSASYSSGVYTFTASGADIYGNADAFRFVYQTLTGDGQITARVDSLTNTTNWAKAGLMVRETLAANARNSYVAVSAHNHAVFQDRVTPGGPTAGVGLSSVVSKPYWLKLVRQGNTFKGYGSADGTLWALISTQTISMASTVYIGLAATSAVNTMLGTSVFSGVQVGAVG